MDTLKSFDELNEHPHRVELLLQHSFDRVMERHPRTFWRRALPRLAGDDAHVDTRDIHVTLDHPCTFAITTSHPRGMHRWSPPGWIAHRHGNPAPAATTAGAD